MLSEVMEHYGLASPLDEAGFFETEHHRTVVRPEFAVRGHISTCEVASAP